MTTAESLDFERCYTAVQSRDRRFDGVFYTAVRTTGIYCRPSCPARTPASRNVSFHRTAAAAQSAGYRACKRCLPDATPGSPEWNLAATVAGRAMRLIADGVVDREGVEGLATRLGYTSRHLGRLLTTELGAGPLALARTQRAQTARALVESTTLSLADVAFAAGFSSVRQFNDTMLEVYAATPSELRGRKAPVPGPVPGAIDLRIAVRTPFRGSALLRFLADRAVPGVEVAEVGADGGGWYARTLDLPHGPGVARVDLADLDAVGSSYVPLRLVLDDLRDTAAALARMRAMLDADADPVAVDEHLSADPLLRPLVAARPGLRVPGHVDGAEIAVRAVLGQQVTVVAARTAAARLVAAHGRPVTTSVAGLTHLFPDAATVAALDPEDFRMPRARGRALIGLSAAIAAGDLVLDRGPDRGDVRRDLVALPGIGPWTADYIALRALGHPDVWLPTDVGVRNALARHDGAVVDPEAWAPWRSYALLHLWTSLEG
ncbi:MULTISPECIES: AlkA N-terminal domain-containing protein [Pimelobacter]|uniref:AlkA N-terminal domain-containing protein n=1 Tax=Pimelobacter TaxID=2044 RepID=UPI001C046A9E|nr:MULTISPECIES: AlkA N-terminal domain-containing protein [Pimelobacter]MBU2698685.1 AraC family transcriptional regulator [Pimelobacter sp. 30-1]UUW89348.1 helix-turn-helix domain-containing protein [Pimelobacter simplex]UUW93176.1 helix-turn-helix domain-containing protein [Pimelobacter simplex]